MRTGLRNICPECAENKEKNFLKVRDFIKDNPKVSIEVVIEATGVSEIELRQFLREGLIEVANFDGTPLTCQRCGKPISRGLYCAICHQDFGSGDTEGKGEKKKKTGSKDKRGSSLVLQFRKRK